MLAEAGNLLPVWRKYLVIFKGKRYLYGIAIRHVTLYIIFIMGGTASC